MLLESCGTVQIKDSAWFGDEGREGATEFHTLTNETHDYTLAEWDKLRFGMLCTPATTFADWKSVIEKLCSESGKCTYETKKKVNAFMKKVNKVSHRR